MLSNEPNMSIENQINKGLKDVRANLVALTDAPTEKHWDQIVDRINFEIKEIERMVYEHRFRGINRPWSARKPAIDEEFS